MLIADAGYGCSAAHQDIHVVADGADAARRIREQRPELIFLDVEMPELDGLEVIERVGVDVMPPVVFGSGAAMAAGWRGWLTAPSCR